MLYLIDNYDSFTYNLYQQLGTLTRQTIRVVKNDQCDLARLQAAPPSGIVLSPGPGTPAAAGQMPALLARLAGRVPILGVCLGHQAIGELYGARTVHAPQLMHGRTSQVYQRGANPMFKKCPRSFTVARYHSLVIDPATCPAALQVTAQAEDGTIQAVADDAAQLYGVQFHPESIMTQRSVGTQIIRNFLALTEGGANNGN